MSPYVSCAYARVPYRIWKTYLNSVGSYPPVCPYQLVSFRTSHALDRDYHYPQREGREENPKLSKQHQSALSTLVTLGERLKNVYEIDGRLAKTEENFAILDVAIKDEIQEFKHLALNFLGYRLPMQASWRSGTSTVKSHTFFAEPHERASITFDSLKVICDYLKLSVQQRRLIRKTVSPQVTQYGIWKRALEEMVKELDIDLAVIGKSSNKMQVGKQATARCIQLLSESLSESSSWVKLGSGKKCHSPNSRWGEVLESFNVISDVLRDEVGLSVNITKIESMKEGLNHIKDVQLDNEIGFQEMHQRQWLVKHKFVENLGHTSKCLFTLLLFYLFQSVRSIKVDIAGGLYEGVDDNVLCMGEIVTSTDSKMIWRAVKHLDKALTLAKFIYETAEMRKPLRLQGHIWTLGAQENQLEYRGNTFFVHGIESD
eukprot:Gb_41347 [translate_table: standard]